MLGCGQLNIESKKCDKNCHFWLVSEYIYMKITPIFKHSSLLHILENHKGYLKTHLWAEEKDAPWRRVSWTTPVYSTKCTINTVWQNREIAALKRVKFTDEKPLSPLCN